MAPRIHLGVEGFAGRKVLVPVSKFHVFQTSLDPFTHCLGFGCVLHPKNSSCIISWNLWNLFIPEGNVLGLGEVLCTLSLFREFLMVNAGLESHLRF